MKRFAKSAILVGLSLGAVGTGGAQTACPGIEGAAPEVQLKYLQGERSGLKDECIVYALGRLARAEYKPAIEVLIRYLDYSPPAQPRKDAVIQYTAPWLGTKYPAARGLLAVEKAAVPSLVAAIACEDTPELVRKNAIELVWLLHREDPPEGAAVLNRAAHAAARPDTYQRLMDAARVLAGLCSERYRGICLSNALK